MCVYVQDRITSEWGCLLTAGKRTSPRCGAAEQAQWRRRQQARLLPVPYYLLTLTVPGQMRDAFLHFPQELYPAFFAAVSGALKALCARKGSSAGTWDS